MVKTLAALVSTRLVSCDTTKVLEYPSVGEAEYIYGARVCEQLGAAHPLPPEGTVDESTSFASKREGGDLRIEICRH